MVGIELDKYQLDAIKKMENGSVLCGAVGSGKSRTALAYYYILNGGKWSCLDGTNTDEPYFPMQDPPMPLYIITTAKKRDSLEWESEMVPFLISSDGKNSLYKNHTVVVDSWNNIKKYTEVSDSFFIFDEQRLVGSGAWVKAFYKIAKKNQWILLTATPGDNLSDYIPLFVAHGFYKNATDFKRRHVVYKPYVSYPVIDRYISIGRPLRLRDKILVDMDYKSVHNKIESTVMCKFDKLTYSMIKKESFDPREEDPSKAILDSASAVCYALRNVVNSDPSRLDALKGIISKHPRSIIFYNFDYELEMLIEFFTSLQFKVAQWNGHKHEEVPGLDYEKWVYLVQYNAGSEGWNCVTTNTIIFYSQTYSYKQLQQAMGRIDRRTSPFRDLYYYHLRSKSSIDMSIFAALKKKKKFNESRFINGGKQ